MEMASTAETTTISDHSACEVEEASSATAPPIKKETAAIYNLTDIFLYLTPLWGMITFASIVLVFCYIK